MTLALIDADAAPLVIRRVPEGVARQENRLRDLLLGNPAILPIGDIDSAIGPLVPIARELNVPGVGRIDALFADAAGHLVIVECKLWRNPQARREVVGQILDYARALARFNYEDLQREISAATGRKGNALFELVSTHGRELEEARFVDRVSRNLTAGRLLLMIVGDGITEGTQRIGEFLQDQPGLSFDFALVEVAEYRFHDPLSGCERLILQPRVLAKTALLERSVVRIANGAIIIDDARAAEAAVAPRASSGRQIDPAFQQAWRDFAERFIAGIEFDDPAQPPPRVGGIGWLRLPLPLGMSITLWRGKTQETVGAFVRFAGSEGQARFDALESERPQIDEELRRAGFSQPEWDTSADAPSLSLSADAPLPWDDPAEQAQAEFLARAANQLVNSLRPRLERLASAGAQA